MFCEKIFYFLLDPAQNRHNVLKIIIVQITEIAG